MASCTSSMALSLRIPVGTPFASRMISPPATSGVSASTPASCSASELASAMCPSRREIQTGLSGVIASIQSRRGSSPPQFVWSHAPPVIHSPGSAARANAAIRNTNSSGVGASRSCTDARELPPARKCTCVSMNPGTSRPPSAAICSVPSPIYGAISAADPTATISVPETATASAQGIAASPVQTRAPVTTSDAGGTSGAEQATAPASSPATRKLRL